MAWFRSKKKDGVEYTIVQGETTSTNTSTVTLSANKYYLFDTV